MRDLLSGKNNFDQLEVPMNKRSKPVFNGAEKLTAIIYLCAISTVMMYLLCRDHMLICTVFMTALCAGIYMLFYMFRDRRLISFVVFLALLTAVALTVTAVGTWSLMEFIYTTSDFFEVPLAVGSIVLFSFVVTYPVFYFTVRLPRPVFLMLPALAPLILDAGTLGTLPLWLTAFLAASYFMAVMGVARVEYPSEYQYVDDRKARKERLTVIGILGAAAAGLLMIIPRSSLTPYADYLDATRIRGVPFYGGNGLSGFMQSSSPNTGNNRPSENTLFYVITDNPRNIITQSFDLYRGKGGWTYHKDYNYGVEDWRDEQWELNYNKLAYLLKNGAKEGKLEEFAEDLLRLPDVPVSSIVGSTMTIQIVDNSDTTVVRHPSGTYDARISYKKETIYRNEKDELFTASPFGTEAMYTLSYYGKEVSPEFARYISGLSSTEYFALLDAAAKEDVIEDTAAMAFKNAYYQALYYRVDTSDASISPRVQELADQITEGLDNDYDKARAIEEWFGKDGFIYDLDFVPQELSAEYFLFKSKRGICTDFATASALLLRAAGIPARYTEGFLVKTDLASMDLYGRYVVKANQGHAFATAYVPGSGWIEVDGTKYAEVASLGKEIQIRVFFVAVAAGVVAVLFFLFRKRLSEACFVIGYRLRGGKKKIRALYFRIRKIACSISGTDPDITTSGEVRDVISRILLLGDEAGEITDAADAVIYGGAADNYDKKKLYRNYKLIRKAWRSRK